LLPQLTAFGSHRLAVNLNAKCPSPPQDQQTSQLLWSLLPSSQRRSRPWNGIVNGSPRFQLGAQKFGKQRFPALLKLDDILDEAIGLGQRSDASFDPVQFALELSQSRGHSGLLAKVNTCWKA
jgi:hypothetical protein